MQPAETTAYAHSYAQPLLGQATKSASLASPSFEDSSRTTAEGVGLGQRVFFEPGEEHWHGAAPDRFMTHLALLNVDEEGHPADWGDHVT